MSTRTAAIAAAGLIAISTAIAFALTGASKNTSTPAERPRPIAGITSEEVPNVPERALADPARAFFTSLLERQYRAQSVPIRSAVAALATRLEALPVAGSPDTQVEIVAMRYAQKAAGVRQVTVQVDQHLADGTTQPLAANFAKVAGVWRAVSLPTLDGDTTPANAPPSRRAPAAATRVARAYALAARSYTPDTLRSNYQRQLQLSTGALRAGLLRSPPSAALITAYRADNARMTAVVRDIQVVSLTARAVTFSVVLSERTTTTTTSDAQRTVNTAELQLHDGSWLVSTFTASP